MLQARRAKKKAAAAAALAEKVAMGSGTNGHVIQNGHTVTNGTHESNGTSTNGIAESKKAK